MTQTTPTFRLTKTATNRKSAAWIYQVIDQDGKVLSTRESNRDYVACTISGSHYFGRRDLVGKGDHGDMIKMAQGYGRRWNGRSHVWEKVNPLDQAMLDRANQVAYLDETK